MAGPFNTDRLIERVLVARPDATAADAKRIAPALLKLPDADLNARIEAARRRLQRAGSPVPQGSKSRSVSNGI